MTMLPIRKIMLVFGTRPEATKMAPVVRALSAANQWEIKVCVTAQHRQMPDQVLDLCNIKPDFDLNLMKPGQNLTDITSNVLIGMRDVFKKWRLDLAAPPVSRYLKRFTESQIKIFLYEELKNDPVEFIKDLCEFLEVDPSALSVNNVASHKNVGAVPRFKNASAYFPALIVFRKYIGIYLFDNIKEQVKQVMFSSKNVPKLRQDEFEQAMKYFSEDIKKVVGFDKERFAVLASI